MAKVIKRTWTSRGPTGLEKGGEMADTLPPKTGSPFEGEAESFSVAFPTIADIEVVVERYEYGAGHERSRRKVRYGKSDIGKSEIGRKIRCTNPLCHSGGILFERWLRSLVDERKTEGSRSWICRGYEGSPKGKKVYGECLNPFEVRVRITYAAAQREDADGQTR